MLKTYTLIFLLVIGTASRSFGQESKEVIKSAEKNPATQLFNGKDLKGWRVVEKFDFKRHGKVEVKDGIITMAAGAPASGIQIDSKVHDLPRSNYEVSLEAKRTSGQDFFCGLTFPVGKEYCTLIMGGWGGGTIGLSNVDKAPADENQTTNFVQFKTNQWVAVRLRVTDKTVDVWIDKEHLIELNRADHKFSIWWEQEPVRPFGFASWYTGAAYRKIELIRLDD